MPDPAGHGHGEAAALLGQSEPCPGSGIGERCQNGSAPGDTHRKTLKGVLVEWLRSHPWITLLLLLPLLLLLLALAVALAVRSGRSDPDTPRLLLLACAKDWVGYKGICYFLSRDELSWDQAQARCSQLGASLAVLRDEEMDFLFRLSGNVDYWVGLRRREQGLQWGDGSSFNSSVPVKGNAECVFLGIGKFWSGICSNPRPYLCTKAQTHL